MFHGSKLFEPCSLTRGLNAFALKVSTKGSEDLGWKCSLLVNFLFVKGPVYLMIKSVIEKSSSNESMIM